MNRVPLEDYLERAMQTPDSAVIDAIDRGPIDRSEALDRDAVDRLLDPQPLPCETGWCMLPDGVGYVAVRTEMPSVTGEMIDWWFDWHPREALRYRIWHPKAHLDNSLQTPKISKQKAHWGAVHHPVEDVGVGVVKARISFLSPSEMGMSIDALQSPSVATVICGYAGDDTRRVRHTPMFHVFLREDDGVVLRSRFWLGGALQPYGMLARPGALLLNRPWVRRIALPAGLPKSLAMHCAEEYANLGTLLPELYQRFGTDQQWG